MSLTGKKRRIDIKRSTMVNTMSSTSLIPRGFSFTAHSTFHQYQRPKYRMTAETSCFDTQEDGEEREDMNMGGRRAVQADSLEEVCPICMESIRFPATIVRCCHSYCTACLGHWYRISKSCPLCKCTDIAYVRSKYIQSTESTSSSSSSSSSSSITYDVQHNSTNNNINNDNIPPPSRCNNKTHEEEELETEEGDDENAGRTITVICDLEHEVPVTQHADWCRSNLPAMDTEEESDERERGGAKFETSGGYRSVALSSSRSAYRNLNNGVGHGVGGGVGNSTSVTNNNSSSIRGCNSRNAVCISSSDSGNSNSICDTSCSNLRTGDRKKELTASGRLRRAIQKNSALQALARISTKQAETNG